MNMRSHAIVTRLTLINTLNVRGLYFLTIPIKKCPAVISHVEFTAGHVLCHSLWYLRYHREELSDSSQGECVRAFVYGFAPRKQP